MRRGTARFIASLVPALLLVYATARWVDGRDGSQGPGAAWNVGHVAFLGAFVGFGLLTVTLWRSSAGSSGTAAATASFSGVLLFCWVILTDLSPALDRLASLPDLVMAMGPLVFIAGFVALLAIHCRQAGVPRWWLRPVIALIALVLVGANLDLLPATAALIALSLWDVPLRHPSTGVGSGQIFGHEGHPSSAN